jgi:hypothetical protein
MVKNALRLFGFVALVGGSACGDGGSKAPADPRAKGASEFTTAVSQTAGGNPGSSPTGFGPTARQESPGFVEPQDVVQVRGSTLFVLNEYRGLLIIDNAGERPRVIGRAPLPGHAFALLLEGNTAFALVDQEGAQVVAIDVTDLHAPIVRTRLALAGAIVGVHRRGNLLDVVARGDLTGTPSGNALVTVDLASGTPALSRRVEITGPGWIDQATFSDTDLYVARAGGMGWNGTTCAPLPNLDVPLGDTPEGCSQLTAIDLAAGTASAPIDLRGRVVTGGLLHDGGSLRALLHPALRTKTPDGPHHRDTLAIFRAPPAGGLEALPPIALPTGTLGSGAPLFRFAGSRTYVATKDAAAPLVVIDLKIPDAPVVATQPPTPGIIYELLAASATRVLIRGQEMAPMACPTTHLTMLDVTDPAHPQAMKRLPLGAANQYGWGSTSTGKLLVVPSYGPRSSGPSELVSSLDIQLYDADLDAGTLAPRGRTTLESSSFSRLVTAGTQIFLISPEQLQAVDVGNPDAPTAKGALALAPWVQEVKFAGDRALTVLSQPPAQKFQLQLDTTLLPLVSEPRATMEYAGQLGRLFTQGPMVYMFWSAWVSSGRTEPRLDVLEVVGDQLLPRSSRSLAAVGASVEFGPENDGEGSVASGVRQVGGTTFLLPVHRIAECAPAGGNQPGASSPGSAGFCNLTLPPALPAPPLPSAAAIAESTDVQRLRGAAACPGAAADLLVIDASLAIEPRIASSIRLPGAGEAGPSVIDGTTVFVNQMEGLDNPNAGPQQIRTFVTPIDLSDLANPRVAPRVNVPGPFLAQRAADQTWFTADALVDTAGKVKGMGIVALYHPPGAPHAYLERRLDLEGGASGPVVDDNTVYVTIDGALVAVDLGAPTAPVQLSRTAIPGATSSGSGDSGSGGLLGGDGLNGTPPAPWRPANIHQVVGHHAFVLLAWTNQMLAYDVRDAAHPRLLDQKLNTPRGAMPVRLAPDNRAVVPDAEWGLEIVHFD